VEDDVAGREDDEDENDMERGDEFKEVNDAKDFEDEKELSWLAGVLLLYGCWRGGSCCCCGCCC